MIRSESLSNKHLGFWIYLLTDCILFAAFFITYAVLRTSGKEIFSLGGPFAETMTLLFSSFTSGLAMISLKHERRGKALAWLAVTFALGALFLTLEFREFQHLIQEGHTWQKSAFLSSFFALVGLHGLHITFGLFWLSIMMGQLFFLGITEDTNRRLYLWSLFWHFLDIIWIFIFTIVYLMGVI